jgi:23S rRNA (uracil1939-C5)-methyltransferase
VTEAIERALAICPHAATCPGCPQLGLEREAQRASKREAVARELAPYGAALAPLPDDVRSPSDLLGYRTRAKLVAGAGGALGLFREGTHEVVDLPGCVVQRPVVLGVARAVRAMLAEGALRSAEDGGTLAGLDVREVVGSRGPARALATLLFAGAPPPREVAAACEDLVRRCPEIVSIAARYGEPSPHGGAAPQLLSGRLEVIRGPEDVEDRLDPSGPFHYAAHGSFVQASRATASAIVHHVEQLARTASRPPHVLELFAGSATIGLALARAGAVVVSVEIFGPAIARADRAAREQGLAQRFEARQADADQALAAALDGGEDFDLVVVNPPRRGLSAALRADLARIDPKRVVYVSCEPRTLARDLWDLSRLGFACTSIEAFDMMPQTDKVECVAFLGPSAPPPPQVLHEDEDFVVVRKDPHEPTTPHPEHVSSLQARVRTLPFLGAAQAVHRLDEGTSGLCLFARRPDAVAKLQEALGAATKTYVALVRGIPHKKGRVGAPLDERGKLLAASTRFVRREVVRGHAFVEASPAEGRTHQIRRHLASIGHPVLGDLRYGHPPSNRHLFERFGLDRTFLHLACLVIRVGDRDLVLEAPLAPDLARVLAAMREA